MTVTDEVPATGQPTRSEWATIPKVNLLPPEIIESRRFVRVQRRLAVGVLIVMAACGAVTFWAQGQVGLAQSALDDARARTAQLETDKAKYAEVPEVTAAVDAALTTRERAMASDVLWYRYLNDIALAASNDVWLTAMTVSLASGAAGSEGDPLAPAGIGAVQIAGQTTTLPTVGGWMEALDGITGIKGSALVSATRDTGSGPTGALTFTTTSVLTTDALSHRYDRKAR